MIFFSRKDVSSHVDKLTPPLFQPTGTNGQILSGMEVGALLDRVYTINDVCFVFLTMFVLAMQMVIFCVSF